MGVIRCTALGYSWITAGLHGQMKRSSRNLDEYVQAIYVHYFSISKPVFKVYMAYNGAQRYNVQRLCDT
jgi:hypothetical protein